MQNKLLWNNPAGFIFQEVVEFSILSWQIYEHCEKLLLHFLLRNTSNDCGIEVFVFFHLQQSDADVVEETEEQTLMFPLNNGSTELPWPSNIF